MSKYTTLDFAEDVLKQSKKPLLYHEIWEKGKGTDFEKKVSLKGKTPEQTIGARLFIDVRDNLNSKFIKIGKNPARFFLKERQHELTEKQLKEIFDYDKGNIPGREKVNFHERDLHPLLAHFANLNINFNKGKAIYTKTIHHEKSKKKKPSEWTHPDMVGFYMPIKDWNDTLLNFSKNVKTGGSLKLYSFELKIKIDVSNYRESFFQTVSNSSWANEGYLVTSYLEKNEGLRSELERLTTSFGIGLILLNLDDFDSSKVVFQANERDNLDWELMNKLCDQNSDFNQFIDSVQKDYQVNKIHKSEYDKIITDTDNYIKIIL